MKLIYRRNILYVDQKQCQAVTLYCFSLLVLVIPIKDLRGNPKPRVSPDRTETGPGSGNILKNIFGSGRVGVKYFGSGRGMIFRVGSGRGITFRVGSGRGKFFRVKILLFIDFGVNIGDMYTLPCNLLIPIKDQQLFVIIGLFNHGARQFASSSTD